MDEKNRNKRGLEDISHFFLSGQNSSKQTDQGQEQEETAGHPVSSNGENGTPKFVPDKDSTKIKMALPADAAVRSETNIVESVEEFLKNGHGSHFVSVKNIRSSRFGIPELTLFNKKEGVILCGTIQQSKWFSDFLLASLGYFAWLKECVTASSPFFEKSPRVLLYLFCDRFPSQARQIVKQLKETTSVRLIQYQLLQIPDRTAPIVYYQPLLSANSNKQRTVSPKQGQAGPSQFENATSDHAKPVHSQPDISEEEWQIFNRLKDRAFKE